MAAINEFEFVSRVCNDDYVVTDHVLHGVHTLPGVSFLDLVYRILSEEGYDHSRVELRNVLFKQPVVTTDQFDQQILIQMSKQEDHGLITAKSRSVRGDVVLEQEWTDNLQCELHFISGLVAKTIDPDFLKRESTRTFDLDESYAFGRSVGLVHYSFMKPEGLIYEGKDYYLAEMDLSEKAKNVQNQFFLHPAFIDGATNTLSFLLPQLENKPFIPIYVSRFWAVSPLQNKQYVYIPKLAIEEGASADIVYTDLELYDGEGRQTAHYIKFGAKRVRTESLIHNLTMRSSLPEQITQANTALIIAAEVSAATAHSNADMDIELFLSSLIGELLGKPPESIDPEAGFYDQGLDSSSLLQLVQKLEARLGKQLYPTLLFEYTNIKQLSVYLLENYEAELRGSGQSEKRDGSVEVQADELVYISPVWERLEAAGQPVSGPVLIFDDNDELFRELKAKLGHDDVVLVKPGVRYRAVDTRYYELEPGHAEGYHRLIKELQKADLFPVNIIYHWARPSGNVLEDGLKLTLDRGLRSVMNLTQAIMAANPKAAAALLYAYEGTDQEPQPLYAALTGFNRSLRMENPKFNYKTVELRPNPELSASKLAQYLINEWGIVDNAAVDIRLDSGHRYVKRFELADSDPTEADASSKPGLEDVCLITGGLGALGLLFAKHLASQGWRKIVLAGRSALDAGKQEQISRLEALGLLVLYVQADVSKRKDIERLVREAKKRFGAIHGVIHSAGILQDSYVAKKTRDEMNAVLAPKVNAALYLDEALKDEPLRFFVMFSSISAAVGNMGQSDYAYANGFLDAFAGWREEQRKAGSRQGRSLSINWPLWQDGGMQVDEVTAQMIYSKTGMIALRDASGLQAFDAALRMPNLQVMVLEGNRHRMLEAQGISADSKLAQSAPINMSDAPAAGEEDIAIIGVAGRYPGARNLDEFWTNLRDGKNGITEIPKERWDYTSYFSENQQQLGKIYSKWGGFIEDADKFDPLFFQISPREAVMMDPQERLFLQTAWETMEDAAYTRERLAKDRVGVFVGVMWAQYQLLTHEVNGASISPTSVYSSIANRVSYFFNFTGPSLALDTMCSSSLTALHYACESIRRGESDLAMAGGVNLSIHPNKYIFLSNQRMASSDGSCKSFGEGGDGYVPGEGVGAVLLKPLSKAVADGDHIYAVVKGSAVNSGGKTSGFSVPSPTGQSNVITDALNKSGIDPQSISYIEAHGTGTSLGDPIEINGLHKAFGDSKTMSCAIGSVKSNIGHLESAAGIAAITKVLLQMKHGQLVPSLHSSVLNEKINFAESSFVVQQELQVWKRPTLPVNGSMREMPRRAGVSAFGAGGSNAHIILEEYPSKQEHAAKTKQRLLVLSAHSEEQLLESARRLLAFLGRQQTSASSTAALWRDAAYTLQIGREAMEFRIAFPALTAAEAAATLARYVDGDTSGIWKGCTDGFFGAKAGEAQRMLASALEEGKLDIAAEQWVMGANAIWDRLYDGEIPNRISLPAYPFAQERYWVNGGIQGNEAMKSTRIDALHPLIDVNVSTLSAQAFKKTIRAEEFFVHDHIVSGQKLLPGAAYLELVRAAGELAGNRKVTCIMDVMWYQPVVVMQEELELFIGLFPEADTVAYEVYSWIEENKIVHSQGRFTYGEADVAAEKLDIGAIKSRCTVQMPREEVYRLFEEAGFDYGPAFQVTDRMFGSDQEGLVKLSLLPVLRSDLMNWGLHPSLLDGAFRAIAAVSGKSGSPVLRIPFSLGRMEIYAPITAACYAYAVPTTSLEAEVVKYDIAVLNETGDVAVRIRDFSTRKFKEAGQAAGREMLYYYPQWNPALVELAAEMDNEPILLFAHDHKLAQVLGSATILVQPGSTYRQNGSVFELDPTSAADYERLLIDLAEQQIHPARFVHAWSLNTGHSLDRLEDQKELGLYSLLYLFQAVTSMEWELKSRCLYVFPHSGAEVVPQQEAVAGFANSIVPVNHRFELVTVQIDDASARPKRLAELLQTELAQSGNGMEIRYEREQRFVRGLHRLQPEQANNGDQPHLKHHGVYLITGGAGGLGLLFAEYLAKHYKARLILTGRSELQPEKQAKIEALKAFGGEAVYARADVGRPLDSMRLVELAKSQFGTLNGIFHCAGITGDTLVTDATRSTFQQVLDAKVNGTLNLDAATAGEKLDLFVLFSSISALVGDFGGCAYAVGNAFLDRFASWRQAQYEQGARNGRTISINWPLWQDGGLELPSEDGEKYYSYSGIWPMTTGQGFEAFERILDTSLHHAAVIYGEVNKVNRVLKASAAEALMPLEEEAADMQPEALPSDAVHEKNAVFVGAEQYLKEILAEITLLPLSRIQSKAPLEKYGVDSVMIMEFNNRLEKDFQSLPKTLLFEYGNLHALAEYFAEKHADRVIGLKGLEMASRASKQKHAQARPSSENARMQPSKQRIPNRFIASAEAGGRGKAPSATALAAGSASVMASSAAETAVQSFERDIAIIGVGGRYPNADSLEQFWENLKNGVDSVLEVPKERWDHSRYFDPQKGVKGKTYSGWGGFVNDVDKFDSLFFNISPREADTLDPQERLFLETAWHTLEDAGYSKRELDGGNVGVFVGAMFGQYQLHAVEETAQGNPVDLGSVFSSIPNRVSYFMNWRGPSIAIDTACSSSLEAIRLACDSIMLGNCELAVAGGVNVMTHPHKYTALAQGRFLSADGRCHSFGSGGDGYVPGEGVGAVLLKPLSKAIADGDHIYAVVKGAAVNHGGKTNGYSVPNPNAQGDVISDALRKADIDARTISYIEAHGTGTSLGDPIEIAGLSKAFGQWTDDTAFCSIGSVKSNIGHLESAAGIASVTKVLLQMKHKQLAPSLHARTLNPNIDFAATPFIVQRELQPWERPMIALNGVTSEAPRRAGISGFGAGGTNVHLLLEEYEAPVEASYSHRTPQLIVLSGRTDDRLRANAERLLAYLRRKPMAAQDSGRSDISGVILSKDDSTNLKQHVLNDIVAAASEILHIGDDEIDAQEAFMEYGCDAVKLTELIDRLNETFGIKLEMGVLAEHETAEALSDHYTNAYTARLASRYGFHTAASSPDSDPAEPICLADVAFTLQTGREALDERLAVIALSVEDLCGKLEHFLKGERGEGCYRGSAKDSNAHELLIEDEEGVQFLRQITERGKLPKLAQIWVSGIAVDWGLLHIDSKPRRIPLPGYAFARVSHWYKKRPDAVQTDEKLIAAPRMIAAGKLAEDQTERQKDAQADTLEHFFLAPVWKPDRSTIEQRKHQPGKALLLHNMPQTGLEQALMELNPDDEWITVKLGETTIRHSAVSWQLNTADATALETWLLAQGALKSVLFLHGSSGQSDDLLDMNQLNASQEYGVLSMFRLIKAFSAAGYALKPLDWKVITCNAQGIDHEELINPQSASLFGLMMSMAKEYPSWRVSMMDIDGSELKQKQKLRMVAQQVVAEPADPGGEATVLRGGLRFRRVLEKRRLEHVNQAPFRQNGVYLIVGGAGGIGLELTRFLAKEVQARIVLIGRSALKEEQKRALAEAEAVGGRTLYIQADATNLESMQMAVRTAKSEFGVIHGAVHSAIVLRDRVIDNMDEASFRQSLDPKVAGSAVMYKALEKEPLDFLLFFSSIQSLAGNVGQSNYAAGCTFKDAFAQALRTRVKYPVQVINWGYWGSLGVAATKEQNERFAAVGLLSIGPNEGMEAVARVIAHRTEQVAALKATPALLQRMTHVPEEHASRARLSETQPLPAYASELAQTEAIMDEDELRDAVEDVVLGALGDVLQMDAGDLDTHSPYTDFGVDSVLSIEITVKIKEKLNVDIRSTELFNYPNVRALTDYIVREFGMTVRESLRRTADVFQLIAPVPAPASAASEEQDMMGLLLRLERGELTVDQVIELQKEV
ncbi:acyl transferase domain-containing protein/acyl carrier protein [Paenibacillus harenae]|uniref:SDR family NAD(P)-dependent oxidoreductase n=1 Tax=Paenibacillus harenae TaxID=306543 RepID=UPI00278D8AB9|nr:SDR family NAD(P)-dependent oxidoreductase [Paenibacillus harenae]MDQ0059021.1 acyl transferase domain-containing protein/acyl carrier protein [Paenibacillus harenae]